MTHTLRFLTLLALTGLMAMPVAVDAKADVARDSFERMDKNKDEKVLFEEFSIAFPNMREAAFTAIDRNGDKIIDQEEWTVFIKNHASDMKAARGHGHMNGQKPDKADCNSNMPQPGSADLPLVRPPSDK